MKPVYAADFFNEESLATIMVAIANLEYMRSHGGSLESVIDEIVEALKAMHEICDNLRKRELEDRK